MRSIGSFESSKNEEIAMKCFSQTIHELKRLRSYTTRSRISTERMKSERSVAEIELHNAILDLK